MYYIKKVFNPEIFQGKYKKKNYFEGWYFKLIDEKEQNVLAIIPGVAYGVENTDKHAFIQVIDAVKYNTWYLNFDISEFRFSKNCFEINIGENVFTNEKIYINLLKDNINLSGALKFTNIKPFPKKIFNPGIMGPFSFIPYMECYHGIVNINHTIEGNLKFNNQIIDFYNGSGYIEKDWGKSFPEAWIWLQTNHFYQSNVTLMFSIAKIPWFNTHFTGFVSFLKVNDTFYRFATYTGAKIKEFIYNNENVDITVSDKHYVMKISGCFRKRGILKAPRNGLMERDMEESISSDVEVDLYDDNRNTIFSGKGKNSGMEVVGDVHEFTL